MQYGLSRLFKRFAQSAGAMIRSYRDSLGFGHYPAPSFTTLESLLKQLLQAWEYFRNTLATFFELKNDLRRRRCHLSASRNCICVLNTGTCHTSVDDVLLPSLNFTYRALDYWSSLWIKGTSCDEMQLGTMSDTSVPSPRSQCRT